MGMMYYADSRVAIEVDDRALAHIKMVMVSKLRRNESFTFSWDRPDGGGRMSFWMASTIPLVFEFSDPTPVLINRQWVEEMSQAAGSLHGLFLLPEPELVQ
jgi:hypothetical protein